MKLGLCHRLRKRLYSERRWVRYLLDRIETEAKRVPAVLTLGFPKRFVNDGVDQKRRYEPVHYVQVRGHWIPTTSLTRRAR